MKEDINIKDRKKPTDHRQGKFIRLVDAIQRFTEMQHDDDFWLFDKGDKFDEGHINPKTLDEIQDIMRELRLFDITDIGNLYLTSGGRIVLDNGHGELFDKSDTVLFTIDELMSGMSYQNFTKKLQSSIKEHEGK